MPKSVLAGPKLAPQGLALELLATAGIWFWFLLGFPFANHNESYDWVVWLERLDFRGALSGNLPSVSSLRPIATGSAWLLYRLGGHSIAPVELLNFVVTLAAWVMLSRVIAERRLFALLALITGGVFFSGYIYLFHLHGIFYGPLLVMLAGLIGGSVAGFEGRDLLRWWGIALVLALLHPFSLVFYVAVAIAAPLEFPQLRRPPSLAWLALSCMVCLLAVKWLVPGSRFSPLEQGPAALVTSFRMVEVHPLISAAGLAMIALAAALTWPGAPARFAAPLALALGVAAMRAHLPVLPLWVVLCAIKCVRLGRWTLAALLGASFVLPVASPTGSPTYTVFALMLCAAVTAMEERALDGALGLVRTASALALAALAAVLGLALRSGVAVPALSSLARPILAERERTHQLEALIDETLRSPWRDHALRLYRAAASPVQSDNAVDRTHRPPTQEVFFDHYVRQRRGHDASPGDTLLITFGDDSLPGAEAVLSRRGRFAGEAVVYRLPMTERPRASDDGAPR